MHRTSRVSQAFLGSLLFTWLLLTAAGKARGQIPEPASVLIVPVNDTRTVQMSTKNPITTVRSENPKIASINTVIGEPDKVLVTGRTPGSTMVYLTDTKKNTETFEVRVPADDEVVRQENRRKLLELIRQAAPTAVVDVIASANNTVVLTGVVANVDQVQPIMELARSFFGGDSARIVNSLRIGGVHQVQIQVTVCRVNRSEARSFGFSFLNTGNRHFVASTVGGAGTTTGSIATSVLSAAANLSSTPNAAFGIVNDQQGFLGFLTALHTEGIAKLYAEPWVTTLSGRPGRVVSGGETPILLANGQGSPTVEYKKFGTVVDYLPIVLGNGKIHLEVQASITSLNAAAGVTITSGAGVTSVPGFDERSAKVAVQLEDGQTLAIGGLIQNSINGTTNKVPVLGDLPFVGVAFSTKSYTESEEELLILVTPRLVDPMACTQLPRHLPGRESRSPDDFELFLEGILEAPRGQRNPCPNGLGSYTAAHKTGPTAGVYPCGDGTQPCAWNGALHGRCGSYGCAPSSCDTGTGNLAPGHAGSLSPGGNVSHGTIVISPAQPTAPGSADAKGASEAAAPSRLVPPTVEETGPVPANADLILPRLPANLGAPEAAGDQRP